MAEGSLEDRRSSEKSVGMFTGLVEAVCEVKRFSLTDASKGATLAVDLGRLAPDCHPGDSIAVNGVCLTLARREMSTVVFGVSPETLARSTLARIRPASKVNVERALKAGDRFGGHFVQGHVDGTGRIASIKRLGEFADIEFAVGPELLEQMVPKGSVAVDGVSLTIARIGPESFGVAVIPETLSRTTLGAARAGDAVNIEIDVIVKAVQRRLAAILSKQRPLTTERLKELGF
jgi:riboflavin synthase